MVAPRRVAVGAQERVNVDTNPETSASQDKPKRVIKRYSNRKLYDTQDSRYVTLLQIAEMVRGGEEVQIIDNNTKEDLTEVTLAQIIYEEQKANNKSVPLQTLRDLIQERTERVLTELRETPIGRLIPNKAAGSVPPPAPPPPPAPSKPTLVEQAKGTFEEWQSKIDERVKAIVPSVLPWQQLESEVKQLHARIEELEKKLKASGK